MVYEQPKIFSRLVGWLCFTSHRQLGLLEMAPPFTLPCEGREARFFTPFPPGIDPRVVALQSITLPLRHASSEQIQKTVGKFDPQTVNIYVHTPEQLAK